MLYINKIKESRVMQAYYYVVGSFIPNIKSPDTGDDYTTEDFLKVLSERYKKIRSGASCPVISVVLPVCFNETGKMFIKATKSLLADINVPPTEIIVVINGMVPSEQLRKSEIYDMSTKIGLKVVTISYMENDRYRNIERPQNIFVSRQIGLEEASGNIVLAADVDNIFCKNWIRAYYEAFSKDSTLIAAYGPVCLVGMKTIFGKIMALESTLVKTFKILLNYPPYAGHNHAIRKAIGLKIKGLYSEKIKVHENEIPKVLAENLLFGNSKGYVKCIPGAVILTDFSRHKKQSLKGAYNWFVESAIRNVKQIMRLRKMSKNRYNKTKGLT